MKLIGLLLLAAAAGSSQPVLVGAKVGGSTGLVGNGAASDGFTTSSAAPTCYAAGGSVEARLPRNFGIEFDVVYRHFAYQGGESSPFGSESESVTGGALEFPVLVKRRFPGNAANLYVIAGPALETLIGLRNSWVSTLAGGYSVWNTQTNTGTDSSPATLQHRMATGFSGGGGLEFRAGPVHISPEIRYTYWAAPNFSNSHHNQVEILLGVSL